MSLARLHIQHLRLLTLKRLNSRDQSLGKHHGDIWGKGFLFAGLDDTDAIKAVNIPLDANKPVLRFNARRYLSQFCRHLQPLTLDVLFLFSCKTSTITKKESISGQALNKINSITVPCLLDRGNLTPTRYPFANTAPVGMVIHGFPVRPRINGLGGLGSYLEAKGKHTGNPDRGVDNTRSPLKNLSAVQSPISLTAEGGLIPLPVLAPLTKEINHIGVLSSGAITSWSGLFDTRPLRPFFQVILNALNFHSQRKKMRGFVQIATHFISHISVLSKNIGYRRSI